MSRGLRSITVAGIFGATLAFAAAAARGRESPSPPAQQTYVGSELFKT